MLVDANSVSIGVINAAKAKTIEALQCNLVTVTPDADITMVHGLLGSIYCIYKVTIAKCYCGETSHT